MLVRKLRLWSGILIAIYVVPHVLNHALGLVSLNVMEKVREALALIWFDPPGALIIILAFAFTKPLTCIFAFTCAFTCAPDTGHQTHIIPHLTP